MIVLDTNVVSEFMRPAPDATVLDWLDGVPRGEIWTTTITIAELSAGIAVLPAGVRRDRLETGFGAALNAFGVRILGLTAAPALRYGPIIAARARIGAPISVADALIAAIILDSGATLATRNVRDFADTGIAVIDPWQTP